MWICFFVNKEFQYHFTDDFETLNLYANFRRKTYLEEVNSLAYYGNGGFPFNIVLDMSVTDRRVQIKIINERLKKQKDNEKSEDNVLTDDASTDKIKNIGQRMKQKVEQSKSDYKVPMKR